MIEEKSDSSEKRRDREEIFSQTIRAGRRTYFFDVKVSRNKEHYLTITESKKRISREGKQYYEKHKIFLYREDFERFMEGFNSVLDYISSMPALNPIPEGSNGQENGTVTGSMYSSDISFDDLEKENN